MHLTHISPLYWTPLHSTAKIYKCLQEDSLNYLSITIPALGYWAIWCLKTQSVNIPVMMELAAKHEKSEWDNGLKCTLIHILWILSGDTYFSLSFSKFNPVERARGSLPAVNVLINLEIYFIALLLTTSLLCLPFSVPRLAHMLINIQSGFNEIFIHQSISERVSHSDKPTQNYLCTFLSEICFSIFQLCVLVFLPAALLLRFTLTAFIVSLSATASSDDLW